jgi:Pectinacetylesterase
MKYLVSLVALLAACDTPSDASGPDASPVDAATDAAAAPIVAPPEVWTFAPIDGNRCNHGTPTGIGIRIEPGSKDLLLYFQGGGACSDAASCWLDPSAAAVDGYDASDLASESMLRSYALLDPNATANPFAGMNMVLVPYCTGDAHAGTLVRDLDVDGTIRPTYFVGAANVERMLVRLAATFPDLERVFLVGTSAGGAGATFHFSRVKAALGTTVHTVIDSAPGFADPSEGDKWAFWGVEAPCAGCADVAAVRAFNRGLDPSARYGFLSFQFDPTAANGRSPADFARDLAALRTTLRADANARSFVADNSQVDCAALPRGACHVITTKNQPAALRNGYLAWLRAMVAGSGWNDVTLGP